MKKIFILSIVLLLLINLVSALECQYTQEEKYEVIESKLVNAKSNLILGEPLLIESYVKQVDGNPRIKVTNTLNQDIAINIEYVQIARSDSYGLFFENVSIGKDSYILLAGKFGFNFDSNIDINSVKYSFIKPNVILKNVVVLNYNKTCKMCGDKTCLNEGSSCSIFTECGSSNCIRNYCSFNEICFNNDCKCSSDEIQCNDNKKCVKKNVIPLDVKPECNKFQECVTNYIDPKSGLCAKSPSQLQEEQNKLLKEKEEEQKRLQKEKEEEQNKKIKEGLLQKEKERRYWIYTFLSFVVVILLCGISVYYLWQKRQETIIKLEGAKQETIRIQKEKIIAEANTLKNIEDAKINSQIKLEKEKQDTLKREQEKIITEATSKKSIEEAKINAQIKLEKERQLTLQKEIDYLNKDIESLKLSQTEIIASIEKGKKEVESLKEQIKKSKTQAKADYKKTLEKLEQKQDRRKEKLKLNEEELNKREAELKKKENTLNDIEKKLKEDAKKIEEGSYNNYIQQQLNKYKKEYETPSYEIDYDKEKQYFIIKERKTGKVIDSLHRYIYKKEISQDLWDKEIHHIDYDVLNNELWNLIALKREDHNKEYHKFNHSKLKKGDWSLGIEELKKQLGMKEEDFHKHIRDHMKEKLV